MCVEEEYAKVQNVKRNNYFTHVVVVVGFEDELYSITEMGEAALEVSVIIQGNEALAPGLQGNVTVSSSTGSTMGEYL